ncbi:MAG: ribulose-phosphate 3-epimerase [Eubacteriales bacterium]
MNIIAPSILAANFAVLGEDIAKIKKSGAEFVHFDVMDGNFVPNISFGLNVLSDVRKITDLVLDVHLMIDRPVRYVEEFCDAGADYVTIHVEADTAENTLKALELIRAKGKKAAVSVKPKTPASAVLPFLHLCDMVLIMTVEPGFGGQSFMEDMMAKVSEIRGYINESQPQCLLEVDGGVASATAPICVKSGANVLVAGSAFFKSADQTTFVETLINL